MNTDRRLGICQLCVREHKLTVNNVMVHHGYERPGDGEGIVGDCDAVGYPPIELSCDLVKLQLAFHEERLVKRTQHLSDLETGVITTLYVKKPARRRGEEGELVTMHKAQEPDYMWSTELGRQISSAKYKVADDTEVIAALTKKIAGWTLQPIRIVFEESIQVLAKEVRDQRKTDAQKKRDDKKAKQDAAEAKRVGREATKMDIIQAVRGIFLTLHAEMMAGELSADDTATKIAYVVAEVVKKKTIAYGHFWCGDLKINEELIALGLATPPAEGHFWPTFSFNPGYPEGFIS